MARTNNIRRSVIRGATGRNNIQLTTYTRDERVLITQGVEVVIPQGLLTTMCIDLTKGEAAELVAALGKFLSTDQYGNEVTAE